MLFLSKFHLNKKIKIVQRHFPTKWFSAEFKNEANDSEIISNLSKKIVNSFLIPPLAQTRFTAINEVTGITTKMGHIGWVKISTQTLQIIDWKFHACSESFKTSDEASLLEYACNLKQILPISDLYVMEKIKTREAFKNLNDVRLSSMLMVLLNNFSNGAQEFNRVVFQKENVMNALYNLSIGNERVSARKVFETLLYKANEFEKTVSKEASGVFHSIKNIELKNLEFYDKSSLEQQECLSFVLLLTLSFIDVFICQNVGSLQKIAVQNKFKKTLR